MDVRHSVILVEWILLLAGVCFLIKRRGWTAGAILMMSSLILQVAGGVAGYFLSETINRHGAAMYFLYAWATTTILFAVGFIITCAARVKS